MTPANYKQTVTAKIGIKKRKFQIASIVLQILSVGFIVIGVLYNFYYYIGFLLTYALGLVLYQIHFMIAREYEYALSETQLVFLKKDMRLRSKIVLTLNLSEIKSINIFSDTLKEKEIVVVDDISRPDVKEIEFVKNNETGFVLFAPDEFMTALLSDRLDQLNLKLD